MVWLSGYTARKTHTITADAAGGNLTDYATQVYVYRGTGSDSGQNVYVGSTGCKVDYSDIRFTTEDGSTPLSYWVEATSTTVATCWVKFSNILTTTSTCYIYFGNSSDSSGSDSSNTFVQYAGANSVGFKLPNITATVNIRFRAKVRDSNANCLWGLNSAAFTLGDSLLVQNTYGGSRYGYISNDGTSTSTQESAFTAGVYHTLDAYLTSTFASHYVDGDIIGSGIIDMTNAPNTAMGLTQWIAAGVADQLWSFTSKYVCPEPTHGAWGDIEYSPVSSSLIGLFDGYVNAFGTGLFNIQLQTSATGIYELRGGAFAFATGVYNIQLSQYATGVYSIPKRPPSKNSFLIKFGDPTTANLGNIFKGEVKQKLNQIGTFDVTIAKPSTTLINELVVGATARIFVEDFKYMTGKIKRVEYDRMTGFYRPIGESMASVIRDTPITVPIDLSETAQPSYSIIRDYILPSGWVYNYSSDEGYYIKYKADSGTLLAHLNNICAINGWDWSVDEEYDVYQVVGVGANSVTINGTLPSGYYNNHYGMFITGDGKWQHDQISSNDTTTVTFTSINPVTLGVLVGDKIALFGNFKLTTGKFGAGVTRTFTNNKDIYQVQTNTDEDRVVTTIDVPGVVSDVYGQSATLSMNTLRIASFDNVEDILNANISTSDAYIPLNDPSFYPSSGTVKIGQEKITYTTRDATSLRGCGRGAEGTTAAAHYVGDPCLMQSAISWTGNVTFPGAGTVAIGNERVTYTATTWVGYGGTFTGLTRGADSTTAYNHRRGTWIRDATWTNTASQAGSPVALYGVRGKRVEALGVTDQDGMDKLSQEYLAKYTGPSTVGKGTLTSIAYWQDFQLGDYIAINFATGSPTSIATKLTGFTWQWGKLMEIDFGYPEDFILEDVAKVYQTSDVAVQKTEKSDKTTVVATESSGKYVRVQLPDGSLEWWEAL